MQAKYFGMRFVIPSGGSFKVTIPKEIVDEVWRRTKRELFPVCFFQLNEKLIAEDLEKVARKDYPTEILKKAEEDLKNYGLKVKAKKIMELETQLMEGKISKEMFLMLKGRYEESFQKILLRFRDALKERGLHFLEIKDFEDMLSVLSTMEEKEKDQEVMMILDDIKRFKEDEESLAFLMKQLDKRYNEGRIPESIYERLRLRYEEKLNSARERLRKLRAILC